MREEAIYTQKGGKFIEFRTTHLNNTIKRIYSMFDRAHNVKHFEEVTGFVYKLYENSLIDFYDMMILYTAAAYHDTGRLISQTYHEAYSTKIFRNDQILKRLNIFTDSEIDMIVNIIIKHRGKYEAETEYQKILKDADHSSVLDRIRCVERVIYYQLDHYDEIMKEDIAKERKWDNLPDLRTIVLNMVKYQIERKPLIFIAQSDAVKKLYPDPVEQKFTDEELLKLIDDKILETMIERRING